MTEILRVTVLNMDIVPNILNQIVILLIADVFTHEQHQRDTVTDLWTFRIKYSNNRSP